MVVMTVFCIIMAVAEEWTLQCHTFGSVSAQILLRLSRQIFLAFADVLS